MTFARTNGSRGFSLGPYCAAALLLFATGAAASGVADLFGARVVAITRFASPYLSADFDGDGVPDTLTLVAIKAGAAPFPKDVIVESDLWASRPLGTHGAKLALAIRLGKSGRKFLLTGFEGDDADYFDTPIWGQSPLPLALAKRGSAPFRNFRKSQPRIANDMLVLGTEAGIDTALYWNGTRFAVFSPPEEP